MKNNIIIHPGSNAGFFHYIFLYSDKIDIVGYPKTEYGNERVPEALEGGIIESMLRGQTYEVDTVSGATYTSKAIKEAVKNCVEKAKK